MVCKYLVLKNEDKLESYEPQTKDDILAYYNIRRFKNGVEQYPECKTLKAVQYYCDVKIFNIKPIK